MSISGPDPLKEYGDTSPLQKLHTYTAEECVRFWARFSSQEQHALLQKAQKSLSTLVEHIFLGTTPDMHLQDGGYYWRASFDMTPNQMINLQQWKEPATPEDRGNFYGNYRITKQHIYEKKGNEYTSLDSTIILDSNERVALPDPDPDYWRPGEMALATWKACVLRHLLYQALAAEENRREAATEQVSQQQKGLMQWFQERLQSVMSRLKKK